MLHLEDKYIRLIKETFADKLSNHNYLIYIFGSRARGDNSKYSDVDIAFKGNKKLTLRELSQLQLNFEFSDLPYKVDIIDLNSCSSDFIQIIQNDLVKI